MRSQQRSSGSVRVYTKPKGKLPDFNEPVVLRRTQCSIEGFCNKLHKTMIKQLKYALVWGTSAKHRPQKVGKDHVLTDEDIVQIIKKV
ncbi:GTP-binding protein [Monoraphidium neglectum]|uniref:GTP-binding protein n=1 Tax=Monoraphidium neglectum TaxID=145388 RepID=A0A0D2MJ97_9CHLO|nr:GTP-binding protein [Monoraphidium neglectum]KIZ00672.1 GTP-binding protein [Monoraphidium neglectum]|eukprot:XP_013899691.1 GTP-binding protein [Monoraphidium neglectum]